MQILISGSKMNADSYFWQQDECRLSFLAARPGKTFSASEIF